VSIARPPSSRRLEPGLPAEVSQPDGRLLSRMGCHTRNVDAEHERWMRAPLDADDSVRIDTESWGQC
jgi:hypothetical protein